MFKLKKKRHYSKRPVIKITAEQLDVIGIVTDVLILVSIWFTHYLGKG